MILTDEEDDIFSGGSPRKKFSEILDVANRNLVMDELDTLFDRLAVYEMIMEERLGIEDFDRELNTMRVTQSTEVENRRVGFYIETVANIVSRNE